MLKARAANKNTQLRRGSSVPWPSKLMYFVGEKKRDETTKDLWLTKTDGSAQTGN